MTDKRKDCPMRHENGNCTVAGGFCTAVNDLVCEALHNAFDCGHRSALRQQEVIIKCNDLFDEEGGDILPDKTVKGHCQLNKPLTLNELWQIYEASEPVYLYIFRSDIDSGWEIIEQITDRKIIFRGSMGVYVPIKELGVSYNFYRQKPEERMT